MATPALGTPEYTNYLADQGKTLGLNLDQYRVPTATAPTNTSKVNQVSDFKMPDISPTFGDTSAATAGAAAGKTRVDEMLRMIEAEQAAALKRAEIQAKENSTLLGKLTKGVKAPGEARLAAQKETGIIPKEYFADQKARITEIDALNSEYAATKQAMEQQIAMSRDKLGTNNFINNQIQQIERNAAPKLNRLSANINSKAAVMEALQGNFREAQSYVNQAVQDATADAKFKFDLFNTFYAMNNETFERMDSVYTEAFKSKLALAESEYQTALDEKKQVGDLMMKYWESGINITDTLDEAFAKIGGNPDPYTAAQLENQRIDNARQAGDGSGSGGGSVTGQLDSDAQDFLDGILTEDDFGTSGKDRDYLRKVKSRANQLAMEALEAETAAATAAPSGPTQTSYQRGTNIGYTARALPSAINETLNNWNRSQGDFFKGLFGL